MFQDRFFLVGWHFRHGFRRANSPGDAFVDSLGVCQRAARGDFTGILVGDLQVLVGVNRFVVQIVGVFGLKRGHDRSP